MGSENNSEILEEIRQKAELLESELKSLRLELDTYASKVRSLVRSHFGFRSPERKGSE